MKDTRDKQLRKSPPSQQQQQQQQQGVSCLDRKGGVFNLDDDTPNSRRTLKGFLNHFIDDTTCQLSTDIDLHKFHQDTNVPITDALVREVSITIPKLRTLHLNKCFQITDNSLIYISQNIHEKLIGISLRECNSLTTIGIRNLFLNCNRIKEVDLSDCNVLVDDNILKILAANLDHLEVLSVDNCQKISDQGLCSVAYCCVKLKEISLYDCFRLGEFGNRALRQMGEKCNQMKKLNLHGCKHVNNKGLLNISNGCPYLNHLDVSGCNKLSGVSLIQLAKNCHHLFYLAAASCSKITDNDVCQFVKLCTQITHLDLSYCNLIGVESVKSIAMLCKVLKTLKLSGCRKINDESIFEVAKLPDNGIFKILHLDGCEEITKVAVDALIPRGNGTGVSYLCLTTCCRIDDDYLRSISKHFSFSNLSLSESFRGFFPRDDEVEKRRVTAQSHRRNVSATNIQRVYRGYFTRHYEYRDLRMKWIIIHLLPIVQAYIRGMLRRRAWRVFQADQRRSRAAIKIQSNWRGFFDFQVVRESIRRRLDLIDKQRKALKIQRTYRGHVKRLYVISLKQEQIDQKLLEARIHLRSIAAATAIQCNYRAHNGRKRAREKKTIQLEEQKLDSLKEESAMSIQRIARGRDGRRIVRQKLLMLEQYEVKWFCARQIQARWRGLRDRSRSKKIRQQKLLILQKSCTSRIQCIWRGKKGREKANRRRLFLVLQQKKLRGCLLIQCFFRGMMGRILCQRRRKLKMQQEEMNKASKIVQRLFRGHKGRELKYITYNLRKNQNIVHQIQQQLNLEKKRWISIEEREVSSQEELHKNKRSVLMLEKELSIIEHTTKSYVDSNRVTGAMQRCDKRIVKNIIQKNLELAQVQLRDSEIKVDDLTKEKNQIERTTRELKRKLHCSTLEAAKKKRYERSNMLRTKIRQEKESMILIQKISRRWIVSKAIRSHARSFWKEEWDERNEQKIFVNYLNDEILPFKPLEMKFYEMLRH